MTTNNKNLLGLAISIAAQAHCDAVDKGGNPYILHPLRIMMRLRTQDHELASMAVLHDVVEDSPEWSLEKLRELGFSARVLAALALLTHAKDMPYDEYIRHIGTNADATRIKLEDLKDNTDVSRLKGLRDKDFARMQKYHKAFVYLTEVQALRDRVGY